MGKVNTGETNLTFKPYAMEQLSPAASLEELILKTSDGWSIASGELDRAALQIKGGTAVIIREMLKVIV
ncbi:MAG: hypothetical protein IPM31_13130 [Anaerolineae bacterium]|nr:hypothetical protein [Anaerolineae bacterium]